MLILNDFSFRFGSKKNTIAGRRISNFAPKKQAAYKGKAAKCKNFTKRLLWFISKTCYEGKTQHIGYKNQYVFPFCIHVADICVSELCFSWIMVNNLCIGNPNFLFLCFML